MTKTMNAYKPLEQFLNRKRTTVSLTFAEVEAILGFKLPNPALANRNWWNNEVYDAHSHAIAWLKAGWRVFHVELGKRVTFIRADFSV